MSLRRGQIAAVLAVGIVGVLIPGMQPQLLGALASEGRLTVGALGALASTELLAMGLAAGAAGSLLRAGRLRTIASVALVATGLLDILTPRLGIGAIFAARIAAGLGEGLLIGIAIGFIVRTARPQRWSGIYLALQTLAQFALASAVGVIAADSRHGFAALGLVTLAGLAAVPWLPTGFAQAAAGTEASRLPAARGLLALGGVVAYLAFTIAVWVYVEPLALQRGVSPGVVRLITPLSLLMQVLGAAAATLLAGRVRTGPTLAVVGLTNLAILVVMAAPPSAAWFITATAAFGFLWLFALPFQVPAVIAADPTRSAALLIGGAQLVGASLGPVLAGLLTRENDVAPVLWFGGACLLAGVAALTTAPLGHKAAR